jgi:hypothetical protein
MRVRSGSGGLVGGQHKSTQIKWSFELVPCMLPKQVLGYLCADIDRRNVNEHQMDRGICA